MLINLSLSITIIIALSISLSVDAQGAPMSSREVVKGLSIEEKTRGISPRIRRDPVGLSIDLTIEFGHDSARLTSAAKLQLQGLALALMSEELIDYSFTIVGHTDASGAATYNEHLSLQRAEAVKVLLQELKIAAKRLSAVGRGEVELLYASQPENPENRRVEIINKGKTK